MEEADESPGFVFYLSEKEVMELLNNKDIPFSFFKKLVLFNLEQICRKGHFFGKITYDPIKNKKEVEEIMNNEYLRKILC